MFKEEEEDEEEDNVGAGGLLVYPLVQVKKSATLEVEVEVELVDINKSGGGKEKLAALSKCRLAVLGVPCSNNKAFKSGVTPIKDHEGV